VVVTLSLDAATARLVKTDSLAAIETEGLLGNKFIAVSFGSPGAPEVRDGATLASAPLLDVSDLLRKTNDIMDTTASTMKHLEATSADLAAMTGRVSRGEGSLGALLHERALYDSLTATAVHAQAGAAAFNEDMQALKSNIFFRGYFKDRGYQDASELAKWEIAELPAAAPAKTFSFTAQALFAKPDAAQLKGRKALNEVGAYLEKTPFTLVVIQAFSGGKGDKDANLLLTQAQAMVVRTYLADRFDLDDAKVKTKGMGEATGGVHRVEISVY
jgi:outer membrane protein OmpA-like peptidoglycan-associated protein